MRWYDVSRYLILLLKNNQSTVNNHAHAKQLHGVNMHMLSSCLSRYAFYPVLKSWYSIVCARSLLLSHVTPWLWACTRAEMDTSQHLCHTEWHSVLARIVYGRIITSMPHMHQLSQLALSCTVCGRIITSIWHTWHTRCLISHCVWTHFAPPNAPHLSLILCDHPCLHCLTLIYSNSHYHSELCL